MSWYMVLDGLPNNERRVIHLNGHDILLIDHGGTLIASEARCPHMQLPLDEGVVDAEMALHCPWHRSVFDLHTGEVLAWSKWPPGVGMVLGRITRKRPLVLYEVERDDDGQIWVKVDDEV